MRVELEWKWGSVDNKATQSVRKMNKVKRKQSEETKRRNNERYKRLRDEKKQKIKEHEALCSYLRENWPHVLEHFYAYRYGTKNLPSLPNPTNNTLETTALAQMASSANSTTFSIATTTTSNPNILHTPVLGQTDLTSIMSSSFKPEESPSLDFAAPVPKACGEDDDIITADLSSLLADLF